MSTDRQWMERALANASRVRHATSPNPWVGAVVVGGDGTAYDGATEPPGGRHAERVALDAAGSAAAGVSAAGSAAGSAASTASMMASDAPADTLSPTRISTSSMRPAAP